MAGAQSVSAPREAQLALGQIGGTKVRAPRFRDSSTMLIREAHVALTVDTVTVAVRAIDVIARRYSGVVATANIHAVGASPSATILVRLPSGWLDTAVDALAPLGKVESVAITTEDVSEEFVDVTARLANARHLEQRLLAVLAHRTGKLNEVLEVERQIARVRGDIEQIEGRRRYLASRAAVSTLEIAIRTPAPDAHEHFAGVFSGAIRQARDNTVWILSLAIAALGVVAPLAVVALPVWLLWRRGRRERIAELT